MNNDRPIATTVQRRPALIDFTLDYGEDATFCALPVANVFTSVAADPNTLQIAAEFARNPETGEWPQPESIHYPVIDVDLPCLFVPSTTPGHGHLYIDHPLRWVDFVRLLELLAELGIVEQGYVEACKREGFASVRLPWIKKTDVASDVDLGGETA